MQRRQFIQNAVLTMLSARSTWAFTETENLALVKTPRIMDWTILPYDATAKAWTDVQFKLQLLSNPTKVLRGMKASCPMGLEFRIWENSEDTTYLPLPSRKVDLEGFTEEKLRSLIYEEVGADQSLGLTLPAEIVFRSYIDDVFREALITHPNSILELYGYPPNGLKIIVVENTTTIHNLVLPYNPIVTTSLDKAKAAALDAMRSVGDVPTQTTKCCASGTCD